MQNVINFEEWKRDRQTQKTRPRFASGGRTAPLEHIGALSERIMRRLKEKPRQG
jgi:hypothetical protein